MTFDVGPFALKGGVPQANQGVESLVWDDDRVVGIRGHARNGSTVQEKAKIHSPRRE